MRLLTLARILGVLLLALTNVSVGHAQTDRLLVGADLVEALRQGGYNIYFRHAQTDWSQDDHVEQAGDWTSCDPGRIRQLSQQGRQVSSNIGNAIRSLRIPIGAVFSSPYCRCVETAKLMGLDQISITTDMINLRVSHYFGGTDAIVRLTQKRLATPPLAGTNNIYVAHGNVAREATPVYPGEAEAVVFLPDGKGGFTVVARITPAQWAVLQDQNGK